MAHFPSIISWINDMLDKDVDRDHFYTTFATIRFDVLVCLDTEPYEMLHTKLQILMNLIVQFFIVGCPNLILVEQQETMRKLSFTLVKTLRIIAENTIFHLNGLRKNKRKI